VDRHLRFAQLQRSPIWPIRY
jgi:hypothetical protein